MVKKRVRDYEAEAEAYKEQDARIAECTSRPFPYNVPDFIPFISISIYKEVEEDDAAG